MSTDSPESPTRQPILAFTRYRVRYRERARGDGASLLTSRTGGYLGSAWRGALGRALRQTVCVTRLPVCDGCALLDSCAYPYIFEPRTPPDAKKLTLYPRIPSPYLLEPADRLFDLADGSLNLGITLFGPANNRLSYIVHALARAGRNGLTRRRLQLDLQDVQAERVEGTDRADWTVIYKPDGALHPVPPGQPAAPAIPQTLKVILVTPLRIKRGGHFVGPSDFDFRAFASNLLRRISLLTYFFSDTPLETDFAGLLQHAEAIEVSKARLQWHDWTRYSSRQDAKLQMGGVVGSFELSGSSIEPFWPYLWLGQWTHAGKGCTMGLGRYALEAADEKRSGTWLAPNRL